MDGIDLLRPDQPVGADGVLPAADLGEILDMRQEFGAVRDAGALGPQRCDAREHRQHRHEPGALRIGVDRRLGLRASSTHSGPLTNGCGGAFAEVESGGGDAFAVGDGTAGGEIAGGAGRFFQESRAGIARYRAEPARCTQQRVNLRQQNGAPRELLAFGQQVAG
ncbi:MAG: hypothetical protein AcusKO_05100 [Acuticoccus sp.]